MEMDIYEALSFIKTGSLLNVGTGYPYKTVIFLYLYHKVKVYHKENCSINKIVTR